MLQSSYVIVSKKKIHLCKKLWCKFELLTLHTQKSKKAFDMTVHTIAPVGSYLNISSLVKKVDISVP